MQLTLVLIAITSLLVVPLGALVCRQCEYMHIDSPLPWLRELPTWVTQTSPNGCSGPPQWEDCGRLPLRPGEVHKCVTSKLFLVMNYEGDIEANVNVESRGCRVVPVQHPYRRNGCYSGAIIRDELEADLPSAASVHNVTGRFCFCNRRRCNAN